MASFAYLEQTTLRRLGKKNGVLTASTSIEEKDWAERSTNYLVFEEGGGRIETEDRATRCYRNRF